MSFTKKLVIFGSAEIAELAYYYFKEDSQYKVMAFTVDDSFAKEDSFCGLPLLAFSEVEKSFAPADYDMHVALSYSKMNQLRQAKYVQAKSIGYRLASYICTQSVSWPDLVHGDNCFILENQTLQPTVNIGNNVMLWSGNHIGHGTTIADHTYLASHVVVSGHCKIGERCFFGVNATIKDFTTIGDECFIGMGANVTRDMENGSVALGAPASQFSANHEKAIGIKKRYFNI